MTEKKANVTNTQKLKTVILSVFLAVIVWFMVIYVNDPDITTTVSDLNVRFVGEMSLRDKKLAVTGKDKIPELSVVVTGKRSDLMNFMDDIYVQVDVSDIECNINDEVVLFGTQKNAHISLEELSNSAYSFNYELPCRIPVRVNRVYVYNDKVVEDVGLA